MSGRPHPSIDTSAPFPVAPEQTGLAIRRRLLAYSFAVLAACPAAIFFAGWWLAWVAAKGNTSGSSLGPMAASLVSLILLVPGIVVMRRLRRTACRGRLPDAAAWIALMVIISLIVAVYGVARAWAIDFGLNYQF